MARAGVFLGLMALAVIAAGTFGALHNQVSYTVGPDYFTRFKFIQFGVPPDTAPRMGATAVGVLASWWMGLLAGLPSFLFGLLTIRSSALFWHAGLQAIGVALGVTAMTALAGLLFGYVVVTDATANTVPLPIPVDDPVRFLRAGMMHNASYIGGALGTVAALWSIRRAAKAAT